MIDVQRVIRDFGITNINAESFKNTKTGRLINFSQSNYDWVASQVDYFNSNFKSNKAWQTFTTIIYKWYYNYGFKKYKVPGKEAEERNIQIQKWAEDAYCAFITVYKNRIDLIRYFKGEIPFPDNRYAKRVTKTENLDTEEKQFNYLFQSRIGSLGMYVISLKLEDEEKKREISLDYLMNKTQKINVSAEDAESFHVYTGNFSGYL